MSDPSARFEVGLNNRLRLRWTIRGFWLVADVEAFTTPWRAATADSGPLPHGYKAPCDRRSFAVQALQPHGGYGYLQNCPIERLWRDLRVHPIVEGTNQVRWMIVGRELVLQ